MTPSDLQLQNCYLHMLIAHRFGISGVIGIHCYGTFTLLIATCHFVIVCIVSIQYRCCQWPGILTLKCFREKRMTPPEPREMRRQQQCSLDRNSPDSNSLLACNVDLLRRTLLGERASVHSDSSGSFGKTLGAFEQ